MFLSMNHGGISRAAVRALRARAQGRTSEYVTRDIGAPPPARWQFSQERCRTGATSFVKVTPLADGVCAAAKPGVRIIPIVVNPAMRPVAATLLLHVLIVIAVIQTLQSIGVPRPGSPWQKPRCIRPSMRHYHLGLRPKPPAAARGDGFIISGLRPKPPAAASGDPFAPRRVRRGA